MVRIFLSPVDKLEGDLVFIKDAQTLHHLKVLRICNGERVDILCEKGLLYKGNFISLDYKQAIIEVFETKCFKKKEDPRIILACSLLSHNRFDEIIEKAAEFGLDLLVPVICERTIAKVKKGEVKERWLRRAKQVCRSTGTPFIPEVCSAMLFREAIDCFVKTDTFAFIPHLQAEESNHLLDVLVSLKDIAVKSVIVFIGPEGDFTEQEVSYALEKGCREISLGRLVLRVETAAGFCAGLLSWLKWRG